VQRVKEREIVPGPFAEDEKCREFVANLKVMREMRVCSQADLAAECSYSTSVVSNIETFQRAPLVEHGLAFDKAFKLKDVFARSAREIQGGSFPEAFVDFPEHESTADDLYIYEHSVFPGLVQTARYARAVFRTLPNVTPDDVERKVSARMARQDVLFREEGHRPRLWVLLDEAALVRPVAAADVMHEQCTHVLELSHMPNVSLAVVPYAAGGHIGLSGACTIVERNGVPAIVNLDDLADGRVSDDAATLRRVALRFRSLQHEALPGVASRDMIARVAEELWNGTAPTGAPALTALPTAGSA
jgi:transcriptional regulator with XRE-family HTH domain